MSESRYDLLAMGRSSIDLYSNDIGAPFPEITSFGAFVGGSPTNVSVGTRRLGLNSALLTAVGEDPVGDFILKFLNDEGVETKFIPRKPGHRTSAVLLGIEPPDKFPLVFYRDHCADIQLTIDDVKNSPLVECDTLFVTGTGLSKEPSRSATRFAAELAQHNENRVVLDIDYRADQWLDPLEFGGCICALLPHVDIVIGTEEEMLAAALSDSIQVTIEHSQITRPKIEGDLDCAIERILKYGPEALVVKRGVDGAAVHTANGASIEADPFPVEVLNVLGAGDGFASGFIYGLSKQWGLARAARMGNAIGAIVVTKPGCANFMPTEDEALQFVEARGGF